MHLADALLESDIDWAVTPAGSREKCPNVAVANVVTLHGDNAMATATAKEAQRFQSAVCVGAAQPFV
jgi:hypothetical protein